MSSIIEAVYENGVFKPLQDVPVKEHERVTIKVILSDDWGKRFKRLIEEIHQKTTQYTSDEIEADISQAVKETRQDKYGR